MSDITASAGVLGTFLRFPCQPQPPASASSGQTVVEGVRTETEANAAASPSQDRAFPHGNLISQQSTQGSIAGLEFQHATQGLNDTRMSQSVDILRRSAADALCEPPSVTLQETTKELMDVYEAFEALCQDLMLPSHQPLHGRTVSLRETAERLSLTSRAIVEAEAALVNMRTFKRRTDKEGPRDLDWSQILNALRERGDGESGFPGSTARSSDCQPEQSGLYALNLYALRTTWQELLKNQRYGHTMARTNLGFLKESFVINELRPFYHGVHGSNEASHQFGQY